MTNIKANLQLLQLFINRRKEACYEVPYLFIHLCVSSDYHEDVQVNPSSNVRALMVTYNTVHIYVQGGHYE